MPKKKQARYCLNIPTELYSKVVAAARQRGLSTVDLFRAFTKLGVIAIEIEDDPDAVLIMRKGDQETQLKVIY